MEFIDSVTPRREVVNIDWDAIREQVDLLEVVQAEVHLRQRGKNWVGLCPFHQERTPSFWVMPNEKFFYCHGCHVGGDVIKFVTLIDRSTPYDAATKLMKGVRPSRTIVRDYRTVQRKLDEYKKRVTPPSTQVIPAHLPCYEFRGLSARALEHFHIGIIRDGILIPVLNEDGQPVGYSVRRFDGKPKYLHSKGLDKSRQVFGLHENQQAIKEAGFVIVVEGQFDAVRLWDYGYRNVVSIYGSDMSVEQSLLLGKFTHRIVLMFDGDEAGRAGMKKAREKYSSALDIEQVDLPDGMDPDSCPNIKEYL